jgi:threonine/homoserine/homoserine lactone efflux protein
MQEIFMFLISSLALTLMPGPDILFVINQSLNNKKHGLLVSLGLCSGLVIHTCLISFGLSTFIEKNTSFIEFLKYFGACYLFYLAYSETKNNKNNKSESNSKKYFLRGLYMNLINPKVLLFFIAYLPNFIFSDSIKVSNQILLLGFIFIIQAIIIFSTVSLTSNYISQRIGIELNSKKIRFLNVLIFIIIGILILL